MRGGDYLRCFVLCYKPLIGVIGQFGTPVRMSNEAMS
ncbi:hypothetical protein LMG19083_04667 [Ralstonia psammae]|uniref:Uncharacterized protein n=1 Tax=Ralstonia psammae TaxID=3058598 RepID=A0ABN9JDN9_9RALS|nr:hypothetical protein LMG19083_04667 [Ralstonia sp. LMG 19083]